MIFLDSNIILYAYLKQKRRHLLDEKIKNRKKVSKEIVNDIENGKLNILTTTVHVGEILNILSKKVNIGTAILFLGKLLTLKNVKITPVSKKELNSALSIAIRYKIDPTDALAIDAMIKNKCFTIYTFDSDFKKINGIKVPLIESEISMSD